MPPYITKKGVSMTNNELKHVFATRLPDIMPHILYNAEGKEDLQQEGLLGMWLSLQDDPNCKDRFIKNNVVWKMIQFARKGKSVDSDIDSFKRREKHIEIIKLDAIAEEVSEYILEDKSFPVDDKVIDKIAWERYLQTSLREVILPPDFWTLFYLRGESPTSIWSNFPAGVTTLS